MAPKNPWRSAAVDAEIAHAQAMGDYLAAHPPGRSELLSGYYSDRPDYLAYHAHAALLRCLREGRLPNAFEAAAVVPVVASLRVRLSECERHTPTPGFEAFHYPVDVQ